MNVEAALCRIYVGMAAWGAAGTLVLLVWKGWRFAGGFAIGAILSAVNFHWLKGGVDVLAAKSGRDIAWRGRAPRARSQAAKFVARYALLGAAGYVIFRTSVLSLGAFLAGLFVFVAAILVEMVYELWNMSFGSRGC